MQKICSNKVFCLILMNKITNMIVSVVHKFGFFINNLDCNQIYS